MFKKLLVVSLVACMTLFAGNAFAGWGIPIGNIDASVDASNRDHSGALDFSFSPFGIAVGGGSISGGAEAEANGFIINGTINADLAAAGGGNSQSSKTSDLGTRTENLAFTGASVGLDATGRFGIGGVSADASGYANQHSLNTGGGIANGGFTAGLATQESAGGFGGDAKVGVLFFGSPEAGFDASIQMNGGSYTNSFKTANGLGTEVGAYTTVQSTGGSYDRGFVACADVNGGFSASGNVGTLTVQHVNGGNASASANGSYSGAASLGKTYTGSADGYSGTNAMPNGVMQSWAGMSVTSTITRTEVPE